MENNTRMTAYWKENKGYITILLGIMIFVSLFLGIVFVDGVDSIHIGGFPLGFWIANQGALYMYVIMIYVYVKLMNNLDRKYDVHEG